MVERRKGDALLLGGRTMRVAIAVLVVVSTAHCVCTCSVAYGRQGGYCDQPLIRQYEKLPETFPRLREVPAGGHLSFGPKGLEIGLAVRRSGGPRLVLDGGNFGYALTTTREVPIQLGWKVNVELFSTGRYGQPRGRVSRRAKVISVVQAGISTQLVARVPKAPGFYRFMLSIRDKNGRQLAKFGEYVRVVPTTFEVLLNVERANYWPGEELRARVENLGTKEVRYAKSFEIERLVGSEWTPTGLGRQGPETHIWPGSDGVLGAGAVSPCMKVAIPADAISGEYRIVRALELNPVSNIRNRLTLYGVFVISQGLS